ncbi:RIP metalloprotease RseP [Thermosediminibacter oceani]|uniref:Zinc metalloprotease n=1 Tax=Thermosediminibacter oceani (strain ATCC BAA-1034 / DSM 16646 / JW/IW-1228P) TaxID=555079 RepID=D9S3M9_THEOJ|nr:RIP metalloprotease RseP [Thermosediminibacter oceani]ADL08006.1 membrane-associated zinc metalloprotease [Thermosediminibacter oceani DSM 16646]
MNTIIVSIIVFGVLIFVHEFGHFITAKLCGIKVNEFSMGFGPGIFSVKKGETLYSIRMLPLGGYVRMEGEDEKTQDPRAFSNKPVPARMAVIIAGPLMNLVLAVILIAIIGFFAGVPTTKVTVMPGSPADISGIKDGDVILTVDDRKVGSWDEAVNLISQRPNQTLKVEVLRDGRKMAFNVKTSVDPDTKRGIIGIKTVITRYSLLESLKSGIQKTLWVSSMIFASIPQLIGGKGVADLVGPLGIVHLVGEAAKVGVFNVLYLTAFISINLGLINLLPIPAMDGSRLVFLVVEFLRGKPVDPEKEGLIHFIGFALLMILMCFVLYRDFVRLYM